MPSDTTEPGPLACLRSRIQNAVSRRVVAMLLLGVLAGASLGVLDHGIVELPVVGAVPGVIVGTLGLAVSVGAYQQVGCGGSCNGTDCGCAGDCGDSCSYDA